MSTVQTPKSVIQFLDTCFELMNEEFFNGKLPDAVILIQNPSRKLVLGYYIPGRFRTDKVDEIDEIAITYTNLCIETTKEIVSTLLHEMCHQWQKHFGKNYVNAQHNMEWVKKMRKVGLIASNTGRPGGKQTGRNMSHYIEEDGIFCRFYEDTIAPIGYEIRLKPNNPPEKVKKPRKKQNVLKCNACNFTVRTSADGLSLECLDCGEELCQI